MNSEKDISAAGSRLLESRPPVALDEEQRRRNENWSQRASLYNQIWENADGENRLYRELEARILMEHVGAGPGKELYCPN